MVESAHEASVPQFDPFSDEYFDHPYDLYRRMRDEAPVSFNETYGFWALFRYDDVRSAHLDWQTFTSTHGVDLATLATDPEVVRMYGLMIMMDPPEHERARSLVGRVFTPRAVAALEPMVAEVIDSSLAPFDDADSFDAVADFSGPFPVEIICRMLGVPEGERQQIRHWLDLTLERNPGEPGPTPAGMEAMIASWSYFADLTREKRKRPGDDMISRLTQAEVERPDGQVTRLSDEEIAGFIGLIGGAGAETVTKLVGNAVVLFDQHPDQYAQVVADPAMIPGAVEEVLRFLPPSQYQGRFSVCDSTIGGVSLPAGSPVLLVTGSATRDERFFDRADQFDIGRTPTQALGFGFGIHTCLGAALARMESRLAIGALARRWPDLAVDPSGCRRVRMSNVAGYSRVPVHRALGRPAGSCRRCRRGVRPCGVQAQRVVYTGFEGVQLVADVRGDPDGWPVLLLHGGGQTRHAWGSAAERIADQGWLTVSLDLRGHGESDWAPRGDYSFTAFGGDVVSVADQLGRPPVLVGASLGGLSALYAEGTSDRVVSSGLVLVDITLKTNTDGIKRIHTFMESGLDGFGSLDEAAVAIAAYTPERKRSVNPDGLRKVLRERDGRWYWHWDPAFIGQGREEAAVPTTLVDLLDAAVHNIRVPTMLVRGLLSDIVTQEGVDHLLESVPGSTVVDVAGAAHMIAGDRNDAFSDAVISFLHDRILPVIG